MAYPGYQCVKIGDNEYVSSTKMKSHAVAARWLSGLLAHLEVPANEIRGRPSIKNRQPPGATVYP